MSWVGEWASGTPHSTMMNKQGEILEKKALVIKIAIDMHLRSYRVVRQLDHSSPPRRRSLRRRHFTIGWKKIATTGRAGGGLLRGGLLWV